MIKLILNRDNFITVFREQFEENKRASIHLETPYRTLEDWSSLQSLIVITALDEAFGYVLSPDDLINSKTPEDLFLIMSRASS
jgi:acyl carrier protein